MTIRSTLLSAISALAFVGAAHADSLRPIEGQSIRLGEVSGIAYYTVERDGFRVVATLAQGEQGTPVRVEAVLADSFDPHAGPERPKPRTTEDYFLEREAAKEV